jgi:hypothetical protein
MKFTLYRASGHPIENKEAYLKELNKQMDAIQERPIPSNVESIQLHTQDCLTRWHDKYIINNPISIEVEYTDSTLEDLADKYGTIAFCKENDKLVAYIMDMG